MYVKIMITVMQKCLKKNKILKYNQGETSMTFPFIIYADLESFLEKMSTCYNNSERSPVTKINQHTPSDYSLFTHCSFYATKNQLDCYRGKYCMERFCKDSRKDAAKIINHKKRK